MVKHYLYSMLVFLCCAASSIIASAQCSPDTTQFYTTVIAERLNVDEVYTYATDYAEGGDAAYTTVSIVQADYINGSQIQHSIESTAAPGIVLLRAELLLSALTDTVHTPLRARRKVMTTAQTCLSRPLIRATQVVFTRAPSKLQRLQSLPLQIQARYGLVKTMVRHIQVLSP